MLIMDAAEMLDARVTLEATLHLALQGTLPLSKESRCGVMTGLRIELGLLWFGLMGVRVSPVKVLAG